ncbi:MAG: hypothetical protein J6K32_07515 [Clostridia bacterium]|nr:hypothetical protein [Clostridia bacterium]
MERERSERCCLCGAAVMPYNNPDPVRDGSQDCCNACNRLVIRARRRWYDQPEAERGAYVLRLRSMTYEELVAEFGADQ